jgi:peptidoglycan/xylan/chitin deacetylase (PgdA/CDA1 family)
MGEPGKSVGRKKALVLILVLALSLYLFSPVGPWKDVLFPTSKSTVGKNQEKDMAQGEEETGGVAEGGGEASIGQEGGAQGTMRFEPTLPEVIRRGDASRMEVAITLDDGWNMDLRILDLLEAQQVRCTVFLIGDRGVADAHPDWVRRMDTDGFEVCTHTLNHAKLTDLPPETVKREIVEGQRVIFDITGKQFYYFRPPGGYVDGVVTDVAASLGYKVVLWSLDSGDTRNPSLSAEARASAILDRVKPGEIILFHFGGYKTYETLSLLIPQLRAHGYRLVTLTQLLQP